MEEFKTAMCVAFKIFLFGFGGEREGGTEGGITPLNRIRCGGAITVHFCGISAAFHHPPVVVGCSDPSTPRALALSSLCG